MSNQVAKTILAQIGGSRFVTMTGAHSLASGPNALSFRFRGSNKAKACRITLTGADLYDVEFFKMRGLECHTVETIRGLYHDQLASTFEQVTGLYTSL